MILPPEIRIGISGWNYRGWRGVFYPRGLAQRQELEFASRRFNSIEINGTFYSMQTPASFRRWREETPADFVFSIKGPRFITHMKKLRDVQVPLANFFASGPLALGPKLGPILWQFPPNLAFNEKRFRDFFAMLPGSLSEARRLGRRHDQKLKARAYLAVEEDRPLRYAVEVRHPSFLVADFFALLRERDIAFVIADTAGKFPYAEELTASLVYARLHGDTQLYASGYSEDALRRWAGKFSRWRQNRVLFAYFDNDAKTHAPFDAQRLSELLIA